jgi:hypothetical protein
MIDDDSLEAVAGFGLPGQRMHMAQPAVSEGVVSPSAGAMVLNGRCDNNKFWHVDGYVIEQIDSDGNFIPVVIVKDGQGSCLSCGAPGVMVSKLPEKYAEATVMLR